MTGNKVAPTPDQSSVRPLSESPGLARGLPPQPQPQLQADVGDSQLQPQRPLNVVNSEPFNPPQARPGNTPPRTRTPPRSQPDQKLAREEPSELERASQRESRRSIFQSLTVQDLAAADSKKSLKGMTKSDKDAEYVESVLNNVSTSDSGGGLAPAHLGKTKSERMYRVLRQFPSHFLHTNLMCVIPILVGLIPIGLGAMHGRVMAASLPDTHATYEDLEILEHARPLDDCLLQGLASAVGRASIYVMFVTITSALYGKDVVLPIVARSGLVPWSLHVLLSFLKPVLVHSGVKLSEGLAGMVYNVLIIVGTAHFAVKLGRKLKDPAFWWKMLFFFAAPCVVISAVYRYVLLPRLSEMSNVELLILAAVVNPLLNEISHIMARQLARSLGDNVADESVLGVVPCAAMCVKKCVGRYVCYLITDPALATLASILIAVTEVLFAIQVAVRDRWIYQMQARFASTVDDKAAVIRQVMTHRKNQLLRIRFAHNETSLEICYSATALVMILAYRLSLDGAGLPEIGPLVANFFVQWSSEMVVDLLVVSWLTVVCKKPVLAVSHRLFSGWTAVMTTFVFFGNAYFMNTSIPLFTYARVPSYGGNATWFLLNPDVAQQMSNSSALCAAFPSPASQFC